MVVTNFKSMFHLQRHIFEDLVDSSIACVKCVSIGHMCLEHFERLAHDFHTLEEFCKNIKRNVHLSGD